MCPWSETPGAAAIFDSKLVLRLFPSPEFFGKSIHEKRDILDTYAIKKPSVADSSRLNPKIPGLEP